MGESRFESRRRQTEHTTPDRLRKGSQLLMEQMCRSFLVYGKEHIAQAQEEFPDKPRMIVTPHMSNLDAPSVIAAVGDMEDVVVTADSQNFTYAAQRTLFRLAGHDHFLPVDHVKGATRNIGKFNPDNFSAISDRMNQGQTPWMAAHRLNIDGNMLPVQNGAIYLAQISRAIIIPAALELHGSGKSAEGLGNMIVAATQKLEAQLHIGSGIQLPEIDTSIINQVLEKRANAMRVTTAEKEEFSRVKQLMKQQADELGSQLAALLPKEQRGVYA